MPGQMHGMRRADRINHGRQVLNELFHAVIADAGRGVGASGTPHIRRHHAAILRQPFGNARPDQAVVGEAVYQHQYWPRGRQLAPHTDMETEVAVVYGQCAGG